MTLDETIDRIESDLFEIDMIDMQSAADKERGHAGQAGADCPKYPRQRITRNNQLS